MQRLVALGSVTALAAAALTVTAGAPAISADQPPAAIHTWVPTGRFSTSPFVRVPQAAPDPPPAAPTGRLALSAVRGEYVSAQLAVTGGPDSLRGLRTRVGALTHTGAHPASIPVAEVRIRYAQYIPNDPPSVMIADPLLDRATVDVPASQSQPIWFTLHVPAAAPAGDYAGTIALCAANAPCVRYPLALHVADVVLPPVGQRPFDLSLWFQPDSIATWLGLTPWSDAHFAAMRPYLAGLAELGQKSITVAIGDDPWPRVLPDGTWRSQTYTPYHSTVGWSSPDGMTDWSFDFTIFDRYVEEVDDVFRAVGAPLPRINAFGSIGFKGNNHIVYTDSTTHQVVDQHVKLGDAQWTAAWTAFFTAFQAHLERRGWLDRTHMGFDERPAAEISTVKTLLDRAAPRLGANLFAAAASESADPVTYDLSLNSDDVNSFSAALIASRKATGKVTTWYTWNQPTYPNTLTASPPFGARIIPWISENRNLNGYLRWTYNSWPSDPYTDGTFMGHTFPTSPPYAPGDEYLLYPGQHGPVSSIRWENFRDGLEDAALLDMLPSGSPARAAALDQSQLNTVAVNSTPGQADFDTLLAARDSVVAALQETHR